MHNDIIIIEGKVLILFSAIGLCFPCTYYLLKQAEMVKISSQVNSAVTLQHYALEKPLWKGELSGYENVSFNDTSWHFRATPLYLPTTQTH